MKAGIMEVNTHVNLFTKQKQENGIDHQVHVMEFIISCVWPLGMYLYVHRS